MPGYGFLSEDAEFAEALHRAGIVFIGPSPQSLHDFGLKHRARELAFQAGVPVVPGTGMLPGLEEVEAAARHLGYPIMVKASAGGGGMGLQVCHRPEELEAAVEMVRSRGQTLFKNSGMFLEKYIPNSRHIEAQVFGNGKGDVLFFGERECSLQRRHQKVVEEAPSPFVMRHAQLRNQLRQSAVALAASVLYKSAGTVEFLVDDDSGHYYFLEMNTRLQVEHGITELCYDVDLVELMLKQAAEELAGGSDGDGNRTGGLSPDQLQPYTRHAPTGHAIEVRVYAENPAKDFSPAPGLLQHVEFPAGDEGQVRVRVDSWVRSGTVVSPSFDPLLAKIMVHAATREAAITALQQTLKDTRLQGPPTNLDFLLQLSHSQDFIHGRTLTNTLETSFDYRPCALEFLEPGAYTTVQDFPGRLGVPGGVPVSGPMDDLSFRLANLIVGNPPGTEGFELTLSGPRILFYSPATIALCGAPFSFAIDARPARLYTRHQVAAGSIVAIGGTDVGSKAYLAVRGGLPSVAHYLGSKSTTPAVGWGGYQGRTIRAGDYLSLDPSSSDPPTPPLDEDEYTLPSAWVPPIDPSPRLYCLPGPYYCQEFLSAAGQAQLFTSEWKVSFNSNRAGIRLDGPPPEWAEARVSAGGGEGGSHPSNVLGYGYPLGGVSFTGDSAVVIPVDGANQSGFVCTHTVVRADLFRLGQVRPGGSVWFRLISWADAVALEARKEAFLRRVQEHVQGKMRRDVDAEGDAEVVADADAEGDNGDFGVADGQRIGPGLDWTLSTSSAVSASASALAGNGHGHDHDDGILYERPSAHDNNRITPRLTLRQAGDRGILCEFGSQQFDLRFRARAQQIADAVESESSTHSEQGPWFGFMRNTVPENNSILLTYDPDLISQATAVSTIVRLEAQLPGVESARFASRIVRLPLLFDADEIHASSRRYMAAQRPYAAYLPDSVDFIRRSNGLAAREDVEAAYLATPLLVNAVGWIAGLPIYIPVDPRKRLVVPKFNPSRTVTPAGATGTGGMTSSIYPYEAPGGYVLWGMTLPGCCWDTYGLKPGYSPDQPCLFRPFDQIIFYSVDRAQYDSLVRRFQMGLLDLSRDIEPTVFDMAQYSRLVDQTADEVARIRAVQKQCTLVELAREAELLKQWKDEMELASANANATTDGKDGGKPQHEHALDIAGVGVAVAIAVAAGIGVGVGVGIGVVVGVGVSVGQTQIDESRVNLGLEIARHEHQLIPFFPAPHIVKVTATMTARMWKVLVQKGDAVAPEDTVAILEAMKMEIAVHAPGFPVLIAQTSDPTTKTTIATTIAKTTKTTTIKMNVNTYQVIEVLKEPGDTVDAGDVIMLLDPAAGPVQT
ncbi:hypothetical protein A1O3_10233 [Capronia epimyces CBS 606.96]|uniref:Urea carboxylase n=1 Tax=Capronia epimyces CBS 606.96 TaxID=1182542 RepID=W9XI98_9EURO|nr:uncharacterized protein A1O3_10233 [Capronia epimyces CBS 606.96]EXJ77075.1 hypothetical protein A1O3_10233 [Capronia epimyces CBS 606.96]